MGVGEAIGIASGCSACLGLLLNYARDRRRDTSESQAIRDKLDYISDTARDTREDVRQISRQLNDHNARIGKMETKIEEQARRLDRLEGSR